MIDIRLLRDDPDGVKAALARRGVAASEVDAVIAADVAHRARLSRAEVAAGRGQGAQPARWARPRRPATTPGPTSSASESRRLGEEERAAAAEAEVEWEKVRQGLLYLPNIPADEVPDGESDADNVEIRRWWPGQEAGAPEPGRADHQHGAALGDRRGAAAARHGAGCPPLGLHVPPLPGRRRPAAAAPLTGFALDRHTPAYEEIRPPTVVLTETMVSTGHLPKFADDAYHLERDDLWAIPTAEVPLTSMHRGEILEESVLPLRFTAATACYRREAGSAGRDTRGLLRVHEFDKVELFAYTTPDQALDAQADILRRAESHAAGARVALPGHGPVHRRPGWSVGPHLRPRGVSPGVDKWLEVSSTSWFRDYQARRAQVRYRPAAGGAPQLVHTVNGSALAWPRIWAALVENGRQEDGTVLLPECLAPYLGGELLIKGP